MKLRHKTTLSAAAMMTLAFLGGCASVPEGVQPITGFELDRYLGRWYEIARLDHRFERGMSNIRATYSMRDDGGVNVLNRGYKFAERKWDEATGRAYFVGDTDVGQLKVSFFGPFYGGYNIIELDKENYQYALVAGPNRKYLWILARTPELNQDVLSMLVNKAKQMNFPTDELIYVDHTTPN